jgi:uncharacterized protein YbaP (TraB family)
MESLPGDQRSLIDENIAALPFAQGNAWTARRGETVIQIVGTYHLDDPRHDALLERFGPEIDRAEVVLVEAGPDEEARLKSEMSRDPSLLFLTSGPTLPEQLSEDEWQALSAAMNARGIPAFLASKMQPWYVSMMLGIPACAVADMAKGVKGLDARIIARAEQAEVPIRALEPYDTVFRLFGEMPDETKLDMIRTSLAMDGKAEDYTATLAEAYFAEDVRVTWELGRLAFYDMPGMTRDEVDAQLAEMEEALMNRRNRDWIPVIEAAAEEGPVFAAFGALHLSGEEGVLALLERDGFTIERQPF